MCHYYRYDILNFQRFTDKYGNSTYEYARVGTWDTGELSMNDVDVYWPTSGRSRLIRSVCSEPCDKGQIKVRGFFELFWVYPMS